MSPNSVIIDDVLDPKSVSEIYKSLDESTRDTFFYEMGDNHLYDHFCLSMISIAGQFYDVSSTVGYEFWTRINTKPSSWHQDKDENLFDSGILKFPLCSIVYYCHVENLLGGRLCVETDIITPKTNRVVIFAPGVSHYVEDFTGDRISMLVNPWNRHVSVN